MKINKSGLLVITDLNGTVLDRYNGSANAALPALAKLAQLNIPVIFNSSKTAADILLLRSTLGNTHPFITENGADLYLPSDDNPDQFTIRRFGLTRNHILHVLSEIAQHSEFRYLAFSAMAHEQLISTTGLARNILQLIMQRMYTEPLLWQDTAQQLEQFAILLQPYDLQVLRSGRVVYINRAVNKATPLPALLAWYQEQKGFGKPWLLASGDGKNDLPMLTLADVCVVIRVANKPLPEFRHSRLITSGDEGPLGWNNVMLKFLDTEFNQSDSASGLSTQ